MISVIKVVYNNLAFIAENAIEFWHHKFLETLETFILFSESFR